MKCCCVIVLVIFCLGCTSKKNSVFYEVIPSHLINNENKFDLDNKVYPVNREILYQCTIEHDNKTLPVELKYIRMDIQGTTKPFSNLDPDYSQTVIQYEYLDKNKKRIIKEVTGLVENNINIWLHPPRQADLDVLQLSAFPYIKLNALKNWKWELDASYASYQNAHLVHSYTKRQNDIYESNLGQLECVLIEATTESRFGTTNAKFLYNDIFGFVKMKFSTLEDTIITLDLLNG